METLVIQMTKKMSSHVDKSNMLSPFAVWEV